MTQVSVVVPVYNRVKYLRDTIESIENQKGFDNFEIIVVDDCSTDGSLDLAHELAAVSALRPYGFTVCENHENKGTGLTLQKGFNQAKGEYIAVVDSDDLITPFALKTLAKALDRCPDIDYVWSLYEAFDGNYKNMRPGNRCKWNAPRNQKEVIMQNLIRFSTFHLKMMRAEAYRNKMMQWSDMPGSSVDYAFVLQNMFRVQMRRVDSVCYYYRNKTPGSHSELRQKEQTTIASAYRNEALSYALRNKWITDDQFVFIKNESQRLAEQRAKNRAYG